MKFKTFALFGSVMERDMIILLFRDVVDERGKLFTSANPSPKPQYDE